MQHNIGTIILATTDDIQFLHAIIRQSLYFSSQIVVSFGSHFYNNEAENEGLIKNVMNYYEKENKIIFVRYNIPDDYIPGLDVKMDNYWHCHGRWVAIKKLKNDIEYVLLLDADEIPEGANFFNWLDKGDYKKYDCMKLANYWYFREPTFRAINTIEDSIVFLKKWHVDNIHLTMQTGERTATYNICTGNKIRNLMNFDRPMFHHYSWVRTYKQMIRKIDSWGHKMERDYTSLINEEFSRPFKYTENLFGRTYTNVDNTFNIVLKDT
jgi:hypothetical protein